MVRGLLWVVIATGCGRFGFDPVSEGDGGAVTLTYPRPVIAVLGVTMVDLTPSVSPGAVVTAAPALPAGLTLDAASGRIAGVPTQSVEQTITLTATIGADSTQTALEVTVLPGFVVNTTVDAPDTTAGDGVCETAANMCSLRAAVATVNQTPANRLILMGPGSHTLGSAVAVTADMMIAGNGATQIKAAVEHGAYAAFTLGATRTLRFRDLAIDDFGGNNGGALRVTSGVLDVDRCSFDNNESPGSGGVLFINGGARATFAHCTFTRNASLGGSGGGWGGVIDGEDTNTTIVVTRSYATQNTTAWGSFSHITSGTTLRLENSTLYDNTSTIAGTLASPGGVYTLVNVTITGNTNTAGDSAGIYLYSVPAHYTVTNSIIAFNTDGSGENNCNRNDLGTSLTSGGGNLISDDAANCSTYFTGAGDRMSTDPGIETGMPSDHGGTPTLLLAPGSPARGAGVAAACPSVDQRDIARPVGACDSGAVQMTP